MRSDEAKGIADLSADSVAFPRFWSGPDNPSSKQGTKESSNVPGSIFTNLPLASTRTSRKGWLNAAKRASFAILVLLAVSARIDIPPLRSAGFALSSATIACRIYCGVLAFIQTCFLDVFISVIWSIRFFQGLTLGFVKSKY